MNLNSVREGELKGVFDALEEAFRKLEIDYYLIGAIARDIWYARGKKDFRKTKDVDFAVLIGNKTAYEEVRQFLKDHNNFQDTKENSFVMLTPTGVQVDILPFGEIEIDDGVSLEGAGLINIKVNGFMEVYKTGTEKVAMQTGHVFKVATLPAIVLLKLIAFDDRPEKRLKDARDIANIINLYFELQADLIYTEHSDIFLVSEEQLSTVSLQEIAAMVIGREIKKVIDKNELLLRRIKGILDGHVSQGEKSAFNRNMVEETGSSLATVISWLKFMLMGLSKNSV
jgi:predicted nucleotidyltransferase